MVLMEWDDTFVIGSDAMDEQHHGLVIAINEVHALCEDNADRDTIRGAFVHLSALTREHFACEEAHMESTGFPGLAKHRIVHQNMLAKLDQCLEEFERGHSTASHTCFDFLNFWLKSHILGIDRLYADAPQG